MGQRRQLQFWGIGFALFTLFCGCSAATLLPFIAGAAIAYLLDPLADRLERLGLSRMATTAVITLTAILIFVAPLLLRGARADLPGAGADRGGAAGTSTRRERVPDARAPGPALRELPALHDSGRRRAGEDQRERPDDGEHRARLVAAGARPRRPAGCVTPVVAFYLLLDWDGFVAKIDSWLPRRNAGTVRHLAHEIDDGAGRASCAGSRRSA